MNYELKISYEWASVGDEKKGDVADKIQFARAKTKELADAFCAGRPDGFEIVAKLLREDESLYHDRGNGPLFFWAAYEYFSSLRSISEHLREKLFLL